MSIHDLTAYEVIQEKDLSDLRSEGVLLRHKKTGARVLLMENDDENKVFNIAFRTPPADSTGVPHILEHSVLCGSRKFPLKDPFVELVKGSLNTFLNAMTYPDKTMYPVASCNDQDFRNLMDVYLDAVFYPNIYQKEEIFRQEGWHYELKDVKDPITYNGVVYNEMKGVYASSDAVLQREMNALLFPDNCYGLESGGYPQSIPSLTYENYQASHKRFYHPSNARIFLDGKLDLDAVLAKLDSFLSAYDALEMDTAISLQAPVHPKQATAVYEIGAQEKEENKEAIRKNTKRSRITIPHRTGWRLTA